APESGSVLACHLVDEPEPRVVPRVEVFGVGIAETDDELERNSGHTCPTERDAGSRDCETRHPLTRDRKNTGARAPPYLLLAAFLLRRSSGRLVVLLRIRTGSRRS